jgi:hypothetical protein
MKVRCETCGLGPINNMTVYRTTPKGELPHWRCKEHMPAPINDPELEEVVSSIEHASKGDKS